MFEAKTDVFLLGVLVTGGVLLIMQLLFACYTEKYSMVKWRMLLVADELSLETSA